MYQVKWLLIQVQSRFSACPSNPKSTPPLESCGGKFVLHLVKCRHPRSGGGGGVGDQDGQTVMLPGTGPWLVHLSSTLLWIPPPFTKLEWFSFVSSREHVQSTKEPITGFLVNKAESPKIPKTKFPRLGEADKDLRPIKYPRSFWSLVLPPPSPGWVLGWRSWKIIETPCHSGILEQRDSCILSWGEPGEAFGVPCSPHGRGTEEMAAWFPWAAGHSSATLEQHQEPTHPSCGEAGWGSPGGEARSGPQEWPSETFSTGDCRPAGAKPSRCWLCYSPDSSSPAPGPGAFVTHHPGTETNPQEKVAFLAGDKGE